MWSSCLGALCCCCCLAGQMLSVVISVDGNYQVCEPLAVPARPTPRAGRVAPAAAAEAAEPVPEA